MFCRLVVVIALVWSFAAPRAISASESRRANTSRAHSDSSLRATLRTVTDGFNRRDRAVLRPMLSLSRIYVEIAPRTGAYLSSSQTLVVLESFFSERSAVSVVFDFVTDDGASGSASGTLQSRKDGRSQPLKITLGFSRVAAGPWLVTRIVLN